jgi:hypothetical protein
VPSATIASMAVKIVDVYCKNGHLLFGRYIKMKPGFLMKCYIERIGQDKVGVAGLPVGSDVFCPECKLRIGRIKIVHGMPSVFINHGTVKRIKT